MQAGAPQTIHLSASRRLLAIQLAAHLVAAGSVLVSTIPGWIAAMLLAAVGYSFARLRNSRLPASLVLHADGHFETIGVDGAVAEATVHPHTLVMAPLVVLLYRQSGRLRALALARDSVSGEDARSLRIWLRWRACAPQTA